MNYELITTDSQLQQYCANLSGCRSIAFDTEFVAEHTYRPVLCLIQVAADGKLAVIDALTVGDVRPFWEAVVAPGHGTIVHAGRSEMEFCLHSTGRLPDDVFDVQLAAGLIGVEYPAGYSTLINRLLGKRSQKHETRTDWRRRPLSRKQFDYAVDDVRFLVPLCEAIAARLKELERLDWLAEEMQSSLRGILASQSDNRWRRISGTASLDSRSLAIARELFHWRETEAQRRDRPVRHVLRDDLIGELSKRKTADPKRIQAVRGLERGDLRQQLNAIAAAIERGLAVEDEDCPKPLPKERTPQLSVLGQFLFAAMGSICREAHLAPNLVGTPNDIRELVAYRTRPQGAPERPVKLAQGWRAEFIGHLFDELLAGKKTIRIADPKSDHPLRIEAL